jgi:betaine reductase
MMTGKIRVIHYLNQFFGQVGGEEKANIGLITKEGPVGPGVALEKELGDKAKVAATLICGDDYFSQNPEKVAQEGFKFIEPYQPALFFAGPAFAAGRYGVACGAICKVVSERLGIPVITGMHIENPGVELYRSHAFICKTGDSARSMGESLIKMTTLASKLLSEKKGMNLVSRENLPKPDEYSYFHRMILRNEYTKKTAAERSISKLLAKIKGRPFESEIIVPKIERVKPPTPINNLSACKIALVSDGGLVAKGNPDSLRPRGNSRWATYDIETIFPEGSAPSDYDVVHGGYFLNLVLDDPNRLIPVNVIRDLVKEGKIGKLHPRFFSTSGNSTVARECAKMGDEIGTEVKKSGIDAIILTST